MPLTLICQGISDIKTKKLLHFPLIIYPHSGFDEFGRNVEAFGNVPHGAVFKEESVKFIERDKQFDLLFGGAELHTPNIYLVVVLIIVRICEVMSEFVRDCVKTYPADDFVGAEDFDGSIITEPKDGVFAYWIPEENETCLSYDEIHAYGNGKTLYGWHISELKIYDKPKELGEFKKAGFLTEEEWLFALYPNTHCHYEAWAKKFEITRPPQSWCYVEEVIED